MAASQGYRDWLKAGQPYTLIRPAAALVRSIAAHGITVYHRPNAAHLTAPIPEDHTPFSVTGWPGQNARWKARGVDIMPRSDSFAHRKENADIARRLIRDRDAGVPGVMWIKYLNWTDEDGVCRQERWTTKGEPLRRTTRPSTDKGHIHVSGRSDCDDDARADGYDPLSPAVIGDDMANTWTEAITQGAPGIAGQQRDTVLARAQEFAQAADRKVDQLLAAAQADEVRDKATLAAVQAFGAATGADMTPVITAINAVRDEARAEYAKAAAENAELRAQLEQIRALAQANLSPAELAKLGL